MDFRLKGRHLPTLSFRYINETFQGNQVARPKVEIRLSNGDKSFKIAMLVDSGADISFLPLEVAEILELKLTDKRKSRSASGSFETTLGRVNAELIEGTRRIPLGPMDVLVPSEKIDH